MSVEPAALPDQLRSCRPRVTAARLAIHRAVAETAEHSDAELVALIGTLSRQALHDTLDVLTSAGLLRRIEPAGSPARRETRVADNHLRVVRRACGADRDRDRDCVHGPAPCLEPSDESGFLDEVEATFWGPCPARRLQAAL